MKILPKTPKRKRLTFGLSVAAAALLAMSPLMNGALIAGTEAGRDLMAMLGARSPGERPDGALLDTKLRKMAAITPEEYALPKTRERAEPSVPFAPEPVIPAGTSAVPLRQASYVPGPEYYSPGVPFTSAGPTPGGGGIGGPGDPPPGGPIPPPKPPGPSTGPGDPTSAVPEPAVWLNMIIGFGAIATILRVRRRRQGAAQSQLARISDA